MKLFCRVGKQFKLWRLASFIILLIIFLLQACNNDLDVIGVNSPDPGVVRIYLTADETDNFIVIAGDTARVGESTDSLSLTIGQGRAYRDTDFAVLFKTIDQGSIESYRELSRYINIIENKDGNYKEHLIFESFLPPAMYDSLKISLETSLLQIGYFRIPIEMPLETISLVKIDQKFKINESRTTEIYLRMKPFSSLRRVGDSFHFIIDIEVAEIKYL